MLVASPASVRSTSDVPLLAIAPTCAAPLLWKVTNFTFAPTLAGVITGPQFADSGPPLQSRLHEVATSAAMPGGDLPPERSRMLIFSRWTVRTSGLEQSMFEYNIQSWLQINCVRVSWVKD